MATKVYEGLFLLDSNRYARDPSGVSGQIAETVEKLGGEVLASRMWSEQRLAYPINGNRKGTYWLTYFRLDSGKQADLNRQFQLNDSVMRNLVLKVDDRLVDALVQHATGTATSTPEEDAAAKDAAAKDAPVAEDNGAEAPEEGAKAATADTAN